MKIIGNTMLTKSGESGIGHGLAKSFHKQGNQVVIAVERQGEHRPGDACRMRPLGRLAAPKTAW